MVDRPSLPAVAANLESRRSPSHELTMTVLMTPDMANFSGNVHGGTLLKLLDQVAYACASRYAGAYVVTVSVDQVVFRQPIHVGELVSFLASVNHVGRSSMEIAALWNYVYDRLEKNFRRTVFAAPAAAPGAPVAAGYARPVGGFGRRVAGS